MMIVISLDHVICAGLFLIALVCLLFILMKKHFSFSWKAFYWLLGIVVIGFLLYMGNYAIHHAFMEIEGVFA